MTWINAHILTLVTFFPTLAALLLLFLPEARKRLILTAGLLLSLVEFVLSLHLYFHFTNTGSFEFMEVMPWIEPAHIQYFMGIDGVSLLLILLTTALTPLIFLSSLSAVHTRVRGFAISFLILETGMIGAFAALDLFLFYVFW